MPEKISLSSLGNGAAIELFQVELQKVLDNIQDENTKPTLTRQIILKVTIKPSEDRDQGAVSIDCISKLAPLAPFATHFLIGRERGKAVAQEYNPKQPGLFQYDEGLAIVSKEAAHD